MDRQKEMTVGQEVNRLHIATRNGVCLRAIPHRRNGTELSWEELRDNLCLECGLMPQEILANCGGCGKKLCIEYFL